MKICLINYFLRLKDYPTRNSLSVLRLAEYLKSFSCDVSILSINLASQDLEKIVRENIKGKYDIVGISHYVWSKDVTPKLAKVIRETDSNIKTIIGGPETRYINIDDYDSEIFILGEGEESLLKTIKYITNGCKDSNFFFENANIFDKNHQDAKIVETEIKYANPLFTNFKNIDKDFLYYETSRGCLYNCGYCGFRNREHVANFDLNFVKEEIKRIGEIGFKEVFIVDANVGGDKERAKKILTYFNLYASSSKLTIYLRPEFIDSEMLEILKECNLKDVRIGIQTINPKVPAWIRSNSLYHVTKELPRLSEYNIPWKAELIIGLPGDDFEGLKQSIDFVEEILKPKEYCCYPLSVIKGTPLYELTKKEKNGLWIEADTNLHAIASSSYTNEELKKMQEYAIYRMNNYLETSIADNHDKQLLKKRNKIMYKDID